VISGKYGPTVAHTQTWYVDIGRPCTEHFHVDANINLSRNRSGSCGLPGLPKSGWFTGTNYQLHELTRDFDIFWTNNMNQCCFLSVGVNTFFYFPGWSQPPFFSWIHQPTPPSLAFQLLLEVTKTAPSEHRCAWVRFLGTEGIWRMEGESRWYPGAVAEVLVITGRTPKIGFWKISDRNWLWQCWGLIWVDLDFGYRKKVNQHSLWQTLIGS
jgi:hypothetical protein